jgi:hypothetical protein
MSYGLADYIPFFPCPYPIVVEEWAQVPAPPCPAGMSGLGDIAVTAPGGYFATMDFTQWGVAEWGTVTAGVYLLMSAIGDTKRAAKRVSTRARKIKKGFS